MWIKRTLESYLAQPHPQLRLFPVWLLLGPRQVGKSSLLRRLSEAGRTYVNLDDLEVRARAIDNPKLFLSALRGPVLIDEIQYAPSLLSEIKRRVDEGVEPGHVWLTGSQNFDVMHGVRESLAGRVAILNLLGLTDEEKGENQLHHSLLETGFPKLRGIDDESTRSLYLSSYFQTYIERDVRELLGVEKRREFEKFVRLCAFRTGQLVNYDDLARDTGVSPATAKSWLAVLEDSFVLRLVHPWSRSGSQRLIKTPKLYFLDAGIAAYLAGWRTVDQVSFGPQSGALLETHIFSEISKHIRNHLLDAQIFFWRNKDKKEVDFIVSRRGEHVAIEVKSAPPRARDLLSPRYLTEPDLKAFICVAPGAPNEEVPLSEDGWKLIGPGPRFYDLVLGFDR